MQKLSRVEMQKLFGGNDESLPAGNCSASKCESGYYACCNKDFCGCMKNSMPMTCTKGGVGHTTCEYTW